MRNILLLISLTTLLISCGEKKQEEKVEEKEKKSNSLESVESMAKRHIESKLLIPATEKYRYHIYKEHLDGDNEIDAIITVNRLEYAMDRASKSKKTAQQAGIGFMGNYNYIFYYDGGLNAISPQMDIPSSPLAELKVSFENIQSEAYKDVIVDFRILNASYKDFYTISNHTPQHVFQWKNYDGLKSVESEAYYFEFGEGTLGPVKDILVKKAVLVQPAGEIDLYSYEPEIKKTDELVHRFFYHPATGKYMTKK